jgi:hypothetical protein
MALTMIVMFIIFITCGTQHTTLFITTLSLLFAVFSMYRMEKLAAASAPPAAAPAAPAAAGAAVPELPAATESAGLVKEGFTSQGERPYPGAIELDAGSQWPATAAGSRDRRWLENAGAPSGNYYNYGRSAAPETPGPCADGEANAEDIDADEANTYQVRSRNDPVRATAGTMRRQRDMDRYLREETLEAEERVWWGRHEI